MSILVAYASKYGATQGIAECIAQKLVASGLEAHACPIKAAGDLAGYEAFVIGGAAYMGSWLKDASEFVRRNETILATRPTWLFSSGPLGTATTDAQGRDIFAASEPKEFPELKEAVKPRGVRVFFGALDPSKLGFSERAIRRLPAGRALLPEGDFRDWNAIEAWAESIAHELAPVPAG
jgi:menaquinone-dependent protoporphyrinogen oxidase